MNNTNHSQCKKQRKKVKKLGIHVAMDQPRKFANPSEHDFMQQSTAGQVQQREPANYNKLPKSNNKMHVSPRPPLHKKSSDANTQNDRLILCKGCGHLSANMFSNCCQGGKESKFVMSPSISIGPAGKKRLQMTAPTKSTIIEPPKPTVKTPVNNKPKSSMESSSKNIIKDIPKPVSSKVEPVLVLVSSDDEAPEVSVPPRMKRAAQREMATTSVAVNRKQMHWSPVKDEFRNDLLHLTDVDISSIYEPYMCIKCKKVQIGSYSTIPTERILFLRAGVRLSVSHPTSSQESVTIALPSKHLLKIIWHSGVDLSFLMFYVNEKLAQHIRMQLGMHNESEFYFNSCSEVECEKKLVIFLGELNEDIVNQLNLFYNGPNHDLFQEIKQNVKSFVSSVTNDSIKGNNESSGRMSPTDPNIICHFSPRGSKGAISLTLDDYLCLEEGEFLNDVIIDFYLRYLIFKELDSSVAARTHVFSTFFYKRLTDKKDSTNNDPSISAMERRHNRVQNWTKGVDLFDKDFIIIPINKKWHWFLAIICYPNLSHPVRIRDGEPLRFKPTYKRKIKNVENENLVKEESDRDETSSESSCGGEYNSNNAEEPVKQPCIIIFDSLQGPTTRTRVVKTLRSYLNMEHLRRKGKKKDFTIKTMRGLHPDLPQQPNYYDCGVYTLQYAEAFFSTPLCDYSQSVSLEDWFTTEEVAPKRERISELIKTLRKEQFPNTYFEFPRLLTKQELEEYNLMAEEQQEYDFSENEEDEQEQPEESSSPENSMSWTDTFKNSFSKIKRHFSREISLTCKKPRLENEEQFCDS